MKDNRNLGKYVLNKLLRNPALIHRIQDNLTALKGYGMFTDTLRTNAQKEPDRCIKMIVEQYRDNPPMIKKIVGIETLKMIEEYEGITLADDLDNVFN